MEKVDFEKIKEETKASAEKIWLAGLGAMAKVATEGVKSFEKLVEEGCSVQKELEPKAEKLKEQAKETVKTAADAASKKSKELEDKAAEALRIGMGMFGFVPESKLAEAEEKLREAQAEIRQMRSAEEDAPAAAEAEIGGSLIAIEKKDSIVVDEK